MTPADFNTARSTLGFDLPQTAAWLGINPSTAWRYSTGSPIPGPVARALRLALGLMDADVSHGKRGSPYCVVYWADLAPLLAMEGGE